MELKDAKIEDLVDELLSREKVTSIEVYHGRRFPDLRNNEYSLRLGPAMILIIDMWNRTDWHR